MGEEEGEEEGEEGEQKGEEGGQEGEDCSRGSSAGGRMRRKRFHLCVVTSGEMMRPAGGGAMQYVWNWPTGECCE